MVKVTFASAAILASFFCTNVVCSQSIIKRVRIGPGGSIYPNIVGMSDGSPVRGDLIVVKVEVNRGEDICVTAYPYYYRIPDTEPHMDNWGMDKLQQYFGAPSDRFRVPKGTKSQWRSVTLNDAALGETDFRAVKTEDYNVAVFVPFSHADFPFVGRCVVRYRLRVFVDDDVKDDYFTSWGIFAEITRSAVATKSYQLAASSGPDVSPFELLGADK